MKGRISSHGGAMSSGRTLPRVMGTMGSLGQGGLVLVRGDGPCWSWLGRAGWRSARPSWAGWLREKWKREEGKGKAGRAGPGSASSWVLAHYQIGIRKNIFFFKSFYNLQTNLNSI
jgi:hypothetical protein